MRDPDGPPPGAEGGGFGAFELWCVARGYVRTRDGNATLADPKGERFEQFLTELLEARVAADSLLGF
jgi:hypothetical protein